MKRDEFLKELFQLQEKFDALKPELELVVRDPEIDLEGYVVVWSTLAAKNSPLGRCAKGGTRISPQTTLDEIGMLARTMTLKNAAAGLPLGGAKSGIKGDSDQPGFQTKYCRFVELVKPILKENGGIFGGFGFDIGAKPEHAKWACETLSSTLSFTGKPLEMGGTDYDREGIAGLGVAVAGKVLLALRQKEISQSSFAVQGLGAMGAAVIRYFAEYGAKLITFSDPKLGGTFRLKDPAPALLLESLSRQDFAATESILQKTPHDKFMLDQVLYEDVDVLFPCALQGVITMENADLIKAGYIVEGANNPCSNEARSRLHTRGKTVIPGFIANAGGIIAAYVEMTSQATIADNIRNKTKAKEAKKLTEEKVAFNVNKIINLSDQLGVEPVQAATYHALKNIFSDN